VPTEKVLETVRGVLMKEEKVGFDRRALLVRTAVASAIGAGCTAARRAEAKVPPLKAKLGHQHDTSEETLRLLAALGVNNICSGVPSRTFDENWSLDGLLRLKERVAAHGISLDCLALPLSSAYVTRAENPNIMLGKSPERDREIDAICRMIENAAKAGIPMMKYNLTLLGVVRTESTPGRGGSRYSTFVYEKARREPALTEAGPVSEAMMWKRITYFLKRVVPVAAANKVRIACHPHDPGMPKDEGFRGVHRVLGSVEGLKRFVRIEENPYHGLNFCQGTVSEMLEKPGEEIYDVIRWFGSRGKIFNVHFRNIRGGFLDFRETFPDDGDVDMLRALRTYRDIGYDGMIMPDHVPQIEGDPGGKQAFSFCFGYIRAMMQAVAAEGAASR
jgi:mannonate dehydratase